MKKTIKEAQNNQNTIQLKGTGRVTSRSVGGNRRKSG